ncbi:hypothetical protein G6011_11044 [Alternaria panax]|uniref:Uncharacterized protein n=1 Tax=Alternaria panax TaxID=48097 RepID=A0AAD4NSX7_9PLEO|nr:hypothetical protein G6011_11044 [Alternaria panax]
MSTLGDMQKQLSQIIEEAGSKGYKIEDVIPENMQNYFSGMSELNAAREYIHGIQTREQDLQADNNILRAKLKEKEAEINDQPAEFKSLEVDLQQAHRQIDYYRDLSEDSRRRAQRYQRDLSLAVKDQIAFNGVIAKIERLQNELGQHQSTIQELQIENERAAEAFAHLRAQDARLIAVNEAQVANILSHASQIENENEQFNATFTTLVDNLESEISSAAASVNDKAALLRQMEILYNAIFSEVAPLNRLFSRALKVLQIYQLLFQSLSDPYASGIATLPLELGPLIEGAMQDFSLALYTSGDSVDEHKPDDHEDQYDRERAMMADTPKTTHIGAPHTMAHMDKEAKQRRSDEQVGFIILARDNNKPDAYGTMSDTYGPLPWPGVAKGYNEKYQLCVGPAAMEKRARQHRDAWVARHPTYPISILYTKKPKLSQGRRPDALVVNPRGYRVQSNASNEQVRRTEGVGADELQAPAKPHVSSDRVGGWVPPDFIRNQADVLNRYLDQIRSAEIEKFAMEVFDAQNVSLGAVVTTRGDLESSAVFQQLMNGGNGFQVRLHCSAIAVVQWYVHCLSSGGLAELPAHLLCDDSSLMNLYCFAAQLEDDWIRELILVLWRRFAELNAEVNLGLEDLNLLFESTHSEDPARNFWATTVCTVGLAAQVVEMGECNVDLIAEIQEVAARASVNCA